MAGKYGGSKKMGGSKGPKTKKLGGVKTTFTTPVFKGR